MYRKNAWENLAEDEKEQLSAFAKDYMAFLNNGKTERECVAEGVRQAEAKGFKNLMDVYLNAVFCPLAMVDSAVFEQEGWQLREVTHDLHADGPVGVMTDYEAKFYDQGITINRCVAVKTEDTKCDLYPGMSTDCAPV